MIVKGIIEEDCVNYKKISMNIAFPHCSFKCERECGIECCHNSSLIDDSDIEISIDSIVGRYLNNRLTHALVCAGLEPFDSFDDLLDLIETFRLHTQDDVVIYTGYNEDEISDKLDKLKPFNNIIVKFGRFKPNQHKHYDDVLGVYLASDNQYAKVL